jgi:glycosyltransferase involved in cell wall biosynthesis
VNYFIITDNIPSGSHLKGTFVSLVAKSFNQFPDKVTVFCLRPLHRFRGLKICDKQGEYVIYNLPYMSLGRIKNKYLVFIQEKLIWLSVSLFLTKLPKPDVMYGHFLWPSCPVLEKLKYLFPDSKVVIASGESSFQFSRVNHINWRIIDRIHCVSRKNKDIITHLIDLNVKKWSGKIEVIPNAADSMLFRFNSSDRTKIRLDFGLSEGDILCLFVGHFNKRKNVELLDKAIINLGLKNLYAAFVGEGEYNPSYSRICFKGKLRHNHLPRIFSASDFYVSLSSAEGMSNSIIESVINGCPSIISNTDFNNEIQSSTIHDRVDISSKNAVENSIKKLCLKIMTSKVELLYHRKVFQPPQEYILENRLRRIKEFISK